MSIGGLEFQTEFEKQKNHIFLSLAFEKKKKNTVKVKIIFQNEVVNMIISSHNLLIGRLELFTSLLRIGIM